MRCKFYLPFYDQFLGLDHLDQGCRDQNLRSPMCAMVLLAYHSVITYYLGKWLDLSVELISSRCLIERNRHCQKMCSKKQDPRDYIACKYYLQHT